MIFKNFAPSCERNQSAILTRLKQLLPATNKMCAVLEIGSYSGQHGIYFSQAMPHLKWQMSDLATYHDAINHNIALSQVNNCYEPFTLAVEEKQAWPDKQYDAVFTANTLHIMSSEQVEKFFEHVQHVCHSKTQMMIYGPFTYQGKFTSESNEKFERWLKDRNLQSGIKAFEWIEELAANAGFSVAKDITMPANNQLLVLHRQSL